jgi:hypothetical protein
LLPTVRLRVEDQLTDEERVRVRAGMAALRQRQIEALELLMTGPIPDALRAAAAPVDGQRPGPLTVELNTDQFLRKDAVREIEGS